MKIKKDLESFFNEGGRRRIRVVNSKSKDLYLSRKAEYHVDFFDLPLLGSHVDEIYFGFGQEENIFLNSNYVFVALKLDRVDSFELDSNDDYPLMYYTFEDENNPFGDKYIYDQSEPSSFSSQLPKVISINEINNEIIYLTIENENGKFKIYLHENYIEKILKIENIFSSGLEIFNRENHKQFSFLQINGGVIKSIKTEKSGFITSAEFGTMVTGIFNLQTKVIEGSRIGGFNYDVNSHGQLSVQWYS